MVKGMQCVDRHFMYVMTLNNEGQQISRISLTIPVWKSFGCFKMDMYVLYLRKWAFSMRFSKYMGVAIVIKVKEVPAGISIVHGV